MITLHESDSIDFLSNNGLGILKDCISAEVIEEINGEFSISIEYPIESRLYNELIQERIIVSDVGYGDRQAFRIKNIEETLKSKKIYATHIFYDLADNLLEDVYPKSLNGNNAINWILSKTQYKHNFTGFSDIDLATSARYVRKNGVQALIGNEENSFVHRWGGEINRNNFNISIINKRQSSNIIKTIRYRKNLKGINFNLDFTTVGTRLMPMGYDALMLPEKYIDSPLINQYAHPIIKVLEYSDVKVKTTEDEEGFDTIAEAREELRRLVQKDIEAGIDKPTLSTTIDFAKLSDTQEYKNYKNLEDLYIGDSINVFVEKINIDIEQRIVKTTYNALTKKFTKYELGCVKTNYATQSVKNETKLQEITLPNLLAIAKDNATSQITTALGGYVYKTQGELFIMDTDNPNTAQKVWRWNLNGLGYSSTGINGPYELAMTQDGNIVADFIRTGTMSVSRIEGLSNLLNGYSVQIGLNQENIDMLVAQQTNLENGITELAAKVKINADNVAAEFKQIGGNNLFLNSIGDFESDNWEGNVRTFNSTDILRHSNSPSGNCFNLQKATAKQIVFVKNGTFTISFTYKKLINLAECKVKINGTEYILSELDYTDFEVTLDIVDNNITFEMISDTNNSCYIIDLLLNNGKQKQPWSPNSNEIISGAVKANSSGLEITSNTKNTKLIAGANGVKIKNVLSEETVAEFTDTGTETEDLVVEGKAQIAGLLVQKVGNQVWLSSLL